MTIEGVDFSWARPGGAALARAGKRFVVRYVPYMLGDGTWTRKGLSAAEIKDYRARGLAIALVFESAAARARSGYAAGVADAKASQEGLSRLAGTGIPQDLPIYFAVDFDTTSANWPALDAYLKGAAAVLGAPRVGVYAEKSYIDHAREKKLARYLWQTYAWSGGATATGIHIEQYLNGQTINGGTVDLCRAFQDDFGQWPAEESVVPITTYIPGHSAKIRAGAPIRVGPTTASTARRTSKGEVWGAVIGWAKGSPASGSDQWLMRWAAGRYEFAHKIHVEETWDPTPFPGVPDDVLVAGLKEQVSALSARIAAIKGKVAANAADVADD